jgi:hypothetical protein
MSYHPLTRIQPGFQNRVLWRAADFYILVTIGRISQIMDQIDKCYLSMLNGR